MSRQGALFLRRRTCTTLHASARTRRTGGKAAARHSGSEADAHADPRARRRCGALPATAPCLPAAVCATAAPRAFRTTAMAAHGRAVVRRHRQGQGVWCGEGAGVRRRPGGDIIGHPATRRPSCTPARSARRRFLSCSRSLSLQHVHQHYPCSSTLCVCSSSSRGSKSTAGTQQHKRVHQTG